MSALVDLVRAHRPDLDVRLGFLDLSAPSIGAVLDAVAAAGHRSAVIVPLLLGSAFHARVDLPGLVSAARARHPRLRLRTADVLGVDARLLAAARDRLSEAGIGPADRVGLAVAGVGSSSATANARTRSVARLLAAGTAWQAAPCFATVAPTLADARNTLRARGCARIVVAPWFLAPGLLTDRLAATGLPMAAPLGAHPLLAGVVLDRYDSAVAAPAIAA
jgi:sirohydrochlorin ferrochelatase